MPRNRLHPEHYDEESREDPQEALCRGIRGPSCHLPFHRSSSRPCSALTVPHRTNATLSASRAAEPHPDETTCRFRRVVSVRPCRRLTWPDAREPPGSHAPASARTPPRHAGSGPAWPSPAWLPRGVGVGVPAARPRRPPPSAAIAAGVTGTSVWVSLSRHHDPGSCSDDRFPQPGRGPAQARAGPAPEPVGPDIAGLGPARGWVRPPRSPWLPFSACPLRSLRPPLTPDRSRLFVFAWRFGARRPQAGPSAAADPHPHHVGRPVGWVGDFGHSWWFAGQTWFLIASAVALTVRRPGRGPAEASR